MINKSGRAAESWLRLQCCLQKMEHTGDVDATTRATEIWVQKAATAAFLVWKFFTKFQGYSICFLTMWVQVYQLALTITFDASEASYFWALHITQNSLTYKYAERTTRKCISELNFTSQQSILAFQFFRGGWTEPLLLQQANSFWIVRYDVQSWKCKSRNPWYRQQNPGNWFAQDEPPCSIPTPGFCRAAFEHLVCYITRFTAVFSRKTGGLCHFLCTYFTLLQSLPLESSRYLVSHAWQSPLLLRFSSAAASGTIMPQVRHFPPFRLQTL